MLLWASFESTLITSGLIAQLVIYMVVLLFAISAHEAAHAWMSNRFGDDTARLLGRITLNPVAHTDPIGTLLIPIATLVLFKIAFQWSHLFDQGAVLSSVSEPVGLFLWTSLTVNVSLAVFNLVPIPPLDGSKVLWTILPDSMKPALEALERFGFIILLLVVSSGFLQIVFRPVMRVVIYLLEL